MCLERLTHWDTNKQPKKLHTHTTNSSLQWTGRAAINHIPFCIVPEFWTKKLDKCLKCPLGKQQQCKKTWLGISLAFYNQTIRCAYKCLERLTHWNTCTNQQPNKPDKHTTNSSLQWTWTAAVNHILFCIVPEFWTKLDKCQTFSLEKKQCKKTLLGIPIAFNNQREWDVHINFYLRLETLTHWNTNQQPPTPDTHTTTNNQQWTWTAAIKHIPFCSSTKKSDRGEWCYTAQDGCLALELTC